VHPFLVPGAWLLEGNYFPTGKTPQRVSGVTQTRASEAFPETIEVQGEIRDADDPTSKPVLSTFHLDVVGRQQVRFRMDSIPLGTVLLGRGFYDDAAMALQYASPDRRILGLRATPVAARECCVPPACCWRTGHWSPRGWPSWSASRPVPASRWLGPLAGDRGGGAD